jgi:hypothetical protein
MNREKNQRKKKKTEKSEKEKAEKAREKPGPERPPGRPPDKIYGRAGEKKRAENGDYTVRTGIWTTRPQVFSPGRAQVEPRGGPMASPGLRKQAAVCGRTVFRLP